MSSNDDLQAFYKAFDRAILLVHADMRSEIDMLASCSNYEGKAVTLRDKRYEVLAIVEKNGKVSYPSKEIDAQGKPKHQSQPATKFVSEQTFNAAIKKVLKAVGDRIEFSDGQQLEVARNLSGRISSLEGSTVNKSLDLEAFDTMAEMVGRIEQLEADLVDMANSAFRYRGYWQQGKAAKRGDAYTHNGTIWWALRDTTETPDRDSVDWHVAVRKGKDAQ